RLARAEPDAEVTLYLLDLDAFSVLNEGFGHQVGDRLLRTVAKRLTTAVAGESALVARTGGDEFAILIEDSPDTPDIPVLIEQIHGALTEPEYVDGCGLALNATVGVVRRAVADTTAAELFRAADAALHCARATGRRQWMGYDSAQDARNSKRYRTASALPGAFEDGELEVGYQPVVRLSDRQTVAVDAMLCWTGRAEGGLDGPQTLELAELTGQSVLLGPWLLRTACASLPNAPDSALLRVRLSRLQTADGDLVAAVLKAIESVDAPAQRLEIAFDTEAVLAEFGSAVDNIQVATEIGVRTALCGWDGGPRQLDLVERFGVRSVIMRDPFRCRKKLSAAVAGALESTVSSAKSLGVVVSVDGVRHEPDAGRWAEFGVDTATGALFGEATGLDQALTGTGRPAE
ncbi:MAG TPA: diguanylate cyclase, partial [Micromonosporaceae bacterium]|nr:diguanylate cyclase [Micromonosporaceae bacterium]